MLNEENQKEKLTDEELDALIRLLHAFSLPKTLPVGLRSKLDYWMDKIRPAQNDVLEEQGEKPKYAYYIITGFIYVIYKDENGELQSKRFYRHDSIVALRCFVDQDTSGFTIIAGRDTVLGRISIDGMRNIYASWPEMESFAKTVVMKYDELKDDIRTKLLRLLPEQRARAFYRLYKCLKPAKLVKLTKLIKQYLGVSESSVLRGGTDDEDWEE